MSASDDATARALCRREFERPIALEAGAGTGKTTVLVARLLVWLLGPGWERELGQESRDATAVARRALHGVVAITFTEAAAFEMQERLVGALGQVVRGHGPVGFERAEIAGSDAQAAERARALLDALDTPVATTIHAWCRRILARFPFAAGLAPQFELDIEGRRVEKHARRVVAESLQRALSADPDPRAIELLSRPHEPEELVATLTRLLIDAVSPDELERVGYDAERIALECADTGRALHAFLEIAAPALASTPAGRNASTHATLAMLRELETQLSPAQRLGLLEFEALLEQARPRFEVACKRLDDWSKGKFNGGESSALGAAAGGVGTAARSLRQRLEDFLAAEPRFFETARGLCIELLVQGRAALDAAGIATSGDLLVRTRDLLRARRDVRAEIASEIRQLCVDEFQDTDQTQCEIVRLLAFESGAGSAPSLFVVGDPKQSIYGWRNASLAAYDEFRDELTQRGGLTPRLSCNYRSTPLILAEVERVIRPVMHAEHGLQAEFQPLEAARKIDLASAPPVECWVAWEHDPREPKRASATSSERARAIEATMVAERFEHEHSSGTPWKQMAILMRSTGSLELYLRELRARSIPYDVVGDKSHWRRREVLDAAAWVAVVLDPSDTLSLLTALRSPSWSLPDAALVPLWAESLPGAVAEIEDSSPPQLQRLAELIARAKVHVDLSTPGLERLADWDRVLLEALRTIGDLRRSFREEAQDVFFERLRVSAASMVSESVRPLARYRLANLERFFQNLSMHMEESGGDVAALLRELRNDVREERDAAEARPFDSGLDAVRVLTIHKAKGLDFDTVVLVGMHTEAPHDRRAGSSVARDEHGRSCALLFGVPGPGWSGIAERRRALGAAERVRTLYVAMTRAKRQLILSGGWPEALPARGASAATSHLELWLESAEAEWIPALERAAEGSGAPPESPGLRFVLPQASTRSGPRSETSASEPSPRSTVEADRDRLNEDRVQAEQRMALPRIGTASSLAPEHAAAALSAPDEHGATGRSAAQRLGTLLHRVLERASSGSPPRIADMHRDFEAALAGESASFCQHARALFDTFVRGPLFERWSALQPHVLGREVPILGPAIEGRSLAATSGAIDLLYRDPASGQLVIADYKSERIADAREIPSRALVHAPQLELYRTALVRALGLASPPRVELWFLDAGVVHVLPPELA